MPEFFEYLRNITYYLIFATVVGIFAPAGKYRKFVSMVLGFVLLLLMIQPVAWIMRGSNVPVTQWFAGSLGMPLGEDFASLEAAGGWWDDQLRAAFEEQLESQLSRMLSGAGFTLHSADFGYSYDFSQVTSVRVSVSRNQPQAERIPFIRIQSPSIPPIRIGESEEPVCPDALAVKTLISDFYNLPQSHIYVNVT
ncbi:MAG: stage III sporulation protein AF [Defluviitaleaceae bacterium]|nr:stage III sporulation protein AF [Defluviitaleaceae bacterium]